MSSGATNSSQAEFWLHMAEKCLQAGDLVGCKKLAERAILCDPLVRGVDEILAVAEVHLTARNNSKMNWYSILQLDPAAADAVAVKRKYRSLALLLHPANNKSPGAAAAFKLVVEAYTVLSDPGKKSVFDAELEISTARTRSANTPARSVAPAAVTAAGDGGGNLTFWPSCPFRFYVYHYDSMYSNWVLQCLTCQQVFRAVEIAVPQPIVLGTGMHYSAWGVPCVPASSGRWNQPGQPAVAVPQQLAGIRMHASSGNYLGTPQPYGGNVNVVQPQGPSLLAPQQGEKRVARKRDRDGVQKAQAQAEPRATLLGPEAAEKKDKKPDIDEVKVVIPDGEVNISTGMKGDAISWMHVGATNGEVSISGGGKGNATDGMPDDATVEKEEVPKEV